MRPNGFSLIEILIAIALVAIFLPATFYVFSISITSASQGEKFTQGYSLAQEGMEAIIYLKSQNDSFWDWVSIPANTSPGQYYQPTQGGGNWQLGTTTTAPAVTKAPFTRKVEIGDIYRCGLTICAETDSGSMIDPYSRIVTVYVSWPEKNQTEEVKLETYVTAH